jgi:hypothetical protein
MNEKVTGIVSKVFQYGIGLLGVIFFAMILFDKDPNGSFVSRAISLSLWAIYIGAGIAVLFGIYQFLINVRSNPRSLIGIIVFIAIIVISYMMAKNQPVNEAMLGEGEVTTADLLLTDSGLFTFYALILLAVLSIVFAEVSRIFK